jgi:hypothetical protein
MQLNMLKKKVSILLLTAGRLAVDTENDEISRVHKAIQHMKLVCC